MKTEIIVYYHGISFGFDLDFADKRLTIAFLFWGLNFNKI
jgi:hypothetical protein